jgi:hypothetical protein
MLGEIPIFCDVKADSGNMDPARLKALITPRTKAIMPVHVHGCPADLDEIRAVASAAGVVGIEDAAPEEILQATTRSDQSFKGAGSLMIGKGTPDQIRKVLETALATGAIPPEKDPKIMGDRMREWLIRYGIGIDCSGFVRQALSQLFPQLGVQGARVPDGSASTPPRAHASACASGPPPTAPRPMRCAHRRARSSASAAT